MDTELEAFESETAGEAQRHRNRDTPASGHFIILFLILLYYLGLYMQ